MIRQKTFRDILVHPVIELLESPRGLSEHKAGPAYPNFDNETFARHNRGRGPVDDSPGTREAEAEVDEEVLYGGCVDAHFGHFIGEFCHRIAVATDVYPDRRIVFCVRPGRAGHPLPHHVTQIFDYFSIVDRVLLVDRPTRFSTFHVFEQQEVLGGGAPSPAYLDRLRLFQETKLTPKSPVEALFVSRSRQGKTFAGEEALDRYFAAIGVEVYYPELHSVTDQLATYCAAKTIVFSEGSALHGLQLLGKVDAQVVVLCRRPGRFFGEPFLRARVGSLRYVDLADCCIGGYRRNGTPADSTWTTFFKTADLVQFLSREFPPKEADAGLLDRLREEIAAGEFASLAKNLGRGAANPLFAEHRQRIVKDVARCGRFTFAQTLQCADVLGLLEGAEGLVEEWEQAIDVTQVACEHANEGFFVPLALAALQGDLAVAPTSLLQASSALSWPDDDRVAVVLLVQLAAHSRIRPTVGFSGTQTLFMGAEAPRRPGLDGVLMKTVCLRAASAGRLSYTLDHRPTLAEVKAYRDQRPPIASWIARMLLVVLEQAVPQEGELLGIIKAYEAFRRGDEAARDTFFIEEQEIRLMINQCQSEFWEKRTDDEFERKVKLLAELDPASWKINLVMSRLNAVRQRRLEALLLAAVSLYYEWCAETLANFGRTLSNLGLRDLSLTSWEAACGLAPSNANYATARDQVKAAIALGRRAGAPSMSDKGKPTLTRCAHGHHAIGG